MKKLYILAALLMASTAAHAGNSISFDIEGHHIHIAVPRNCSSLSCLQISAPGLSDSNFGSKWNRDDDKYDDNYSDNSPAPVQKNPSAPAVQAAAPVAQANAPQQLTATQPVPPVASTTTPVHTTVASANPVASTPDSAAPTAAPVAPAPVASAPVPVEAAAPVSDPNSPIGVWATEENKGNVRIEPCGPNLCGYAAKTGEKILISMKPSGSKWTGRIHDPDSGRNYDSTIAMKGTNALKVQGCAFGGMFCGGQTWKRVS
ncbi:MAG: DUF2147 domain-containing protein [Bradyrhizobium sp.]|uniref:DUF2147 domain-containing protein n=1 Tax=Bradyrhizobium sp. TaxID=376 RepID=UPI001C28F19C|nr:DUF2147 domain-containing protein [Bradyrhizobium sp.]MBU6462046.1 DUF2147 domain-containing protein [Pseudomonadota bacterium]MDE2066457.1 DUF2147 domain-containing protein [Bradyrhizobium sp.]